MPTFSAFFYGTLMHPRILKRVIGNDGSHLQFCPAVLLDYTRHHVKDGDYPGVIPYSDSKELFDHELSQEERSVRGTVVTGLRRADILHLDIFEGLEYRRVVVQAHALGEFNNLLDHPNGTEDLIPSTVAPVPDISELSPPMDVEIYIYQDISNLVPKLWSFEEFVKTNAAKWYGDDLLEEAGTYGEIDNDEGEIPEVERRRAAMTAALAAAA